MRYYYAKDHGFVAFSLNRYNGVEKYLNDMKREKNNTKSYFFSKK